MGPGRCSRASLEERRARAAPLRSSPSAAERPAPSVWLGSGGGRSDLAIEKLTELGVREIGALLCERTSGDFRLDRWARVASAAGRQSKRMDVPALAGPTPFAEVVGRPGAIVLDHEAEDAVPFAAAADALLLIGPEAGISDARARARPRGTARRSRASGNGSCCAARLPRSRRLRSRRSVRRGMNATMQGE